MAARIRHLALATSLVSLAGCAMCANPFDYYYAAYGGRLPRTDMVHGRVGSILDPTSGGVLSTQDLESGSAYDTGDVYFDTGPQDGPPAADDADDGVDAAAVWDDTSAYDNADIMDLQPAADSNQSDNTIDRAFEAFQSELPTPPS